MLKLPFTIVINLFFIYFVIMCVNGNKKKDGNSQIGKSRLRLTLIFVYIGPKFHFQLDFIQNRFAIICIIYILITYLTHKKFPPFKYKFPWFISWITLNLIIYAKFFLFGNFLIRVEKVFVVFVVTYIDKHKFTKESMKYFVQKPGTLLMPLISNWFAFSYIIKHFCRVYYTGLFFST